MNVTHIQQWASQLNTVHTKLQRITNAIDVSFPAIKPIQFNNHKNTFSQRSDIKQDLAASQDYTTEPFTNHATTASKICDRIVHGEFATTDNYWCSQNGRTGEVKRMRTIFTAYQINRMEAVFKQGQYMVGQRRKLLANELQLTEAQVKVWFQNRRIKMRKQERSQKKFQ